MSPSLRKVLVGAAFIGLTCAVAVVGYVLAGWGWLEAVYMVVITVFGVGYGEVRPIEDPRLIVFTIFVILAGCSAGIYVVGGFVQMVAEGEIHRAIAERRKSKGIEEISSHVIVCGFGRMGKMLATELSQAQMPLVVLDNNEDRIREAEELGHQVLHGDASDDAILVQAGIHRAQTLATVLSNDAANVFITLSARDLNDQLHIIARGESPATERKLIRSGADRVVLPSSIGALKISNMILRPSTEELLLNSQGQVRWNEELGEIGLQITEVPIDDAMAADQTTVRDVERHGEGGFILVAIKRKDGTFIKNPNAAELLLAGDRLLVLGHQEELPQLVRKVTKQDTGMTYRGVRV